MKNNLLYIQAPKEYLDSTVALESNFPHIHELAIVGRYPERTYNFLWNPYTWSSLNVLALGGEIALGLDSFQAASGLLTMNVAYISAVGGSECALEKILERKHKKMVKAWDAIKGVSIEGTLLDALAKRYRINASSPIYANPTDGMKENAIERLKLVDIVLEEKADFSVSVIEKNPLIR